MSAVYTVFGGTGYLGGRLVLRLLEDGHRVRIAARRPERREDLLRSERAEPVSADITAPDTLSAAIAGAAGVVNATSLYQETAALGFRAFHCDGARRLARTVESEGVGRFVQLSGIGADSRSADPYIAARGLGERAVREVCPEAVIIRPSVMVGHGDGFLGSIAALARSPVFPLFGRGETRLQPVHVDDVADAIARILGMRQPAPLYAFGGPEVLTYREIVLAVARAKGRRTWRMPVPLAVWRALASLAEQFPDPPLTRTQIALVEADNVAADGVPGLRDLGITPRDAVDDLRIA